MQTFVFCLVHHPHVQREAQKEIDELVGTDRLPNLEDFERLPYVQAVVNEVSGIFHDEKLISLTSPASRPIDSSLLYHLGHLTCQQRTKWYLI